MYHIKSGRSTSPETVYSGRNETGAHLGKVLSIVRELLNTVKALLI
jgi:hypothetical protein